MDRRERPLLHAEATMFGMPNNAQLEAAVPGTSPGSAPRGRSTLHPPACRSRCGFRLRQPEAEPAMFGTPNTRPVTHRHAKRWPAPKCSARRTVASSAACPPACPQFCGQLLDRVGAPATKQNGRPGRRRPKFKPKRGDAAEPSPTAKPSSLAQRQATTPHLRHVDSSRHGTVM